VARSDIHGLTTLGCAEVRVVGPRTLVPSNMAEMGVRVCHTLEEGIKDADVVITLRLQNERMSGALLPSSQEYFKSFGLTPSGCAGQAGRHRHAPRPHQPGGGDRLRRGRWAAKRDPAAGDFRHRGAHGRHVHRRRE
jgi:aspartate carbamoyltransferase catalytic subunit